MLNRPAGKAHWTGGGAELQLLGIGSKIAITVRPLTRIAEVALKDERVVFNLSLF